MVDRTIFEKMQPLMYIADKLESLQYQGIELTDMIIALVECRADIKYGNLKRYKYE